MLCLGVVATTTEGLDPTAVNILQQIIELGAESNDATAASMVAMVPGRVTVVEQVRAVSKVVHYKGNRVPIVHYF